MAPVGESNANIDPKDIYEMNMTRTRKKESPKNLCGQVKDPVFCRFEKFLEML